MEPEGKQRGVCNLGNLEAHTWQITDGVTRSTESDNEDLVVLVDETHATVTGNVGRNSLVVLFELHSDTLSNSRVRLLGLNTDLLDNNAGSVGCAFEGLLPLGGLVSFLVTFIGPSIRELAFANVTYLLRRLLTRSLRPALIPRGFPLPIIVQM